MLNLRKYVHIVTLCFLIALLTLQCSVTKEELKRTSTDQQKSKIDQQQVPPFTLKETVSDQKSVSGQQEIEAKQRYFFLKRMLLSKELFQN